MSALRPRVAYFSPLPPDPSGVSDYSSELLPHLAKRWDIDLFVDGYVPNDEIASGHPVIDCSEVDPVPLLADYDAVLYHIGNSESHDYIYDTLLRWSGLVVLHELSLQHFIAKRTAGAGRRDLYIAEMRAHHGSQGAERARRAFWGNDPMPWDSDPLKYPLNRRVLGAATGVLVFSHFAADAVREIYPDLHVAQIDQHAAQIPSRVLERRPTPKSTTAEPEPGSTSADPLETCRFITAGNLTPTKGVELTIRAMGRLIGRIPFSFSLIGRLQLERELSDLVREFELSDVVEVMGRVDLDTLYHHLLDADICICLRAPTLGETSAIAMRALACGLPLVVSDVGWFRELPDDVAVKIPVGGREDLVLQHELLMLARDPARRAEMARAATVFAETRTAEISAESFDAFVQGAGFFRSRQIGRCFQRLVERFRELDHEWPGAAAREGACMMADLSDHHERALPPETWRFVAPDPDLADEDDDRDSEDPTTPAGL